MADFVTTITTPAPPSSPIPLIDVRWEQNLGMSFIAQIKGTGAAPRTPVIAGAGAARPTTGLIFPRGM